MRRETIRVEFPESLNRGGKVGVAIRCVRGWEIKSQWSWPGERVGKMEKFWNGGEDKIFNVICGGALLNSLHASSLNNVYNHINALQ